MSTFADWLRLARVSNLPTTWTNVLVGAMIAGGRPSIDGVVVAAAVTSVLYVAGMILNDVLDAPRDAARGLDRPIPAGRVHRAAAGVVAAALLAAGPALAWWAAGAASAAWAAGLAACVIGYDALKERGPLGLLFMGTCRGLIIPLSLSVQVDHGAALAAANWWVAGGLGIGLAAYVQLVTIAARGEHDGPGAPSGRRSTAWLGGVAAGLPMLAVAGGWWLRGGPSGAAAAGSSMVAVVLTIAGVLGAIVAGVVVRHWSRRLASGGPVPASVMGWLAAICLIDAGSVVGLAIAGHRSGSADSAPIAAGVAVLVAVGSWIVTRLGHRRIAGS